MTTYDEIKDLEPTIEELQEIEDNNPYIDFWA